MKTIHHVLDVDADRERIWAALIEAGGLTGWWNTKLDTTGTGKPFQAPEA